MNYTGFYKYKILCTHVNKVCYITDMLEL